MMQMLAYSLSVGEEHRVAVERIASPVATSVIASGNVR